MLCVWLGVSASVLRILLLVNIYGPNFNKPSLLRVELLFDELIHFRRLNLVKVCFVYWRIARIIPFVVQICFLRRSSAKDRLLFIEFNNSNLGLLLDWSQILHVLDLDKLSVVICGQFWARYASSLITSWLVSSWTPQTKPLLVDQSAILFSNPQFLSPFDLNAQLVKRFLHLELFAGH